MFVHRLPAQLPFSLHALVAEAKRRARRRRVLLAVAVITLAGGVSGVVAATHPFGWLRSSATATDYRPGGLVLGTGGGAVSSFSPAGVFDVSAVSRGMAWIVGQVAWRWDGTTWSAVPLPAQAVLTSVAAAAPNDVWAVGNRDSDGNDRPLIEHWDGTRWSVIKVPGLPGAAMVSVSAAAPDDVWALGRTWHPTGLVLLHWNGRTWRTQSVPPTRPEFAVDKVVATGASSVWLVPDSKASVEYWNGEHWRVVPPPFGPHDGIADFSATGWNDAWAVGSYGVGGNAEEKYSRPLAAHWNGSTWTITPVPDVTGDNDAELDSVVALGPNDAWAIGQSQQLTISGNQTTGGGLRGLIVHWDGSRWTATPESGVPRLARPSGIAAAPDGSAWAIGNCGSDNVVLGWNGASWAVVPHPPDVSWTQIVPRRQQRRELRSCAGVGSGG